MQALPVLWVFLRAGETRVVSFLTSVLVFY